MTRAPMASRLQFGAKRMRMACAVADWEAVAREAAALRALADALIGHSRWQVAERQALETMISAMCQALEAVEKEREHIATSMAEFNRQRTAWLAYAIHGDTPETAA